VLSVSLCLAVSYVPAMSDDSFGFDLCLSNVGGALFWCGWRLFSCGSDGLLLVGASLP